MHFKSLKELHEDLSLSLLALDHIWMLRGIIDILDIFDINKAATISINFSESFFNKSSSEIIQFTSNCHEELVYIESAVSVSIKLLKEKWNIIVVNANFKISASFLKFWHWDALASIIIHNSK